MDVEAMKPRSSSVPSSKWAERYVKLVFEACGVEDIKLKKCIPLAQTSGDRVEMELVGKLDGVNVSIAVNPNLSPKAPGISTIWVIEKDNRDAWTSIVEDWLWAGFDTYGSSFELGAVVIKKNGRSLRSKEKKLVESRNCHVCSSYIYIPLKNGKMLESKTIEALEIEKDLAC